MSENMATASDSQALHIDPLQTITFVKVEPSASSAGENVTDIQNYLETFNKEIEGQDPNQVAEGQEGLHAYYVDESGQFYYQQPVVAVMSSDGEGTVQTKDGQNFVAVQQPANLVQSSAQHSENEGTVDLSGENGGNPMLINATEGPIGTVTLMQPDSSMGNFNYVLIVQQPEAGDKQDMIDEQSKALLDEEQSRNLEVYEFDDNEEGNEIETMESENEDDKSKIVKIIPKKSQTVTTAHMCNYCNYTSPKRYLLSRHMKSHSEERPHKCSVCERGFKTLASLQNHVNTHTGTKPHQCKFCESAFTTSGELVRHVRYRHTHEKPHRCPECDYASVELSKLKRHIRCHTGERPYQVSRMYHLFFQANWSATFDISTLTKNLTNVPCANTLVSN